jgi:hypothetical protein
MSLSTGAWAARGGADNRAIPAQDVILKRVHRAMGERGGVGGTVRSRSMESRRRPQPPGALAAAPPDPPGSSDLAHRDAKKAAALR